MHDENKIVYFAETDSRGKKQKFGIKTKDRSRHVYVIGKTGMGKSTLLENMAVQDIQNGEGMAFIDPHGKTAELLLEYVPASRIQDVIYFAPFDTDFPISFNVMEDVGADKRHLVANGLMSAFKKIWVDAWSARMEYILNNILLALLEYPDSTLIGVNRMLADKDYRNKVVNNITDPSVKAFWTDEFAKYGDRYMQEAGAAIQNKIGQFIANPLVRNIIGQPKSTFDLRKVIDERKILIINLSKGRVGEANANLLGSMLITKIYLGAMSRADTSEKELNKLPPFYLFVDEFQSFANESFADILSEARKYKLNLTMAHQYIEQMSEEVRAAVFGNVGTMIMFRVGAYDAEVLEKEFAPEFTAEDLVNLGFTQIYLKLMIDGVTSHPFSATSLPPIETPTMSSKDQIIESSRKIYARSRAVIEEYIRDWHAPIKKEEKRSNEERPFSSQKEIVKNHPKPFVPATPLPTTQNPFKAIAFDETGKAVVEVAVKKAAEGPHLARLAFGGPLRQSGGEASKPPAEDETRFKQRSYEREEKPITAPQVSQTPVSLKNLRVDDPKKRREQKGPSEKNLSELKAALADVLQSHGGSKKEESLEPKQEVKKEELVEKKETLVSNTLNNPKEISESTLKKILEVPK